MRGLVLLLLAVGLTGCDLSPVSPTAVPPEGARAPLGAQPGRVLLDGVGAACYSACLNVANPSGGSPIQFEYVDSTVYGPDNSVYGSQRTFTSSRVLPGTSYSSCQDVQGVRSFRRDASRYQVILTYRFLDGTQGTLTGSSTINLPPFR